MTTPDLSSDWRFIPARAGAGGMGSGANYNDKWFAAAIIREPLLFDLADDPDEAQNPAAQYPQKMKARSVLLRDPGAICSANCPQRP